MGCASSSSLNDRHLHRPKRFGRRKEEGRQGIYVVGSLVAQRAYFSQERSKNRVRSWSPEETESSFDEAVLISQNDGAWSVSEKESTPRIVHRKQVSEALSDSGGYSEVGEERGDAEDVVCEGGGEPEQNEEGTILPQQRSTGGEARAQQPFLPRLHLLESPAQLCPEQERRLRCANLEVPPGLTDLDSEFSDDEGDGFEFATIEGSLVSCDSEHGTPTPLFPGSLCSPNSEALTTDSSFENWERLQRSSISEPELEVLISSDYPLSDHEPSVSVAFAWSPPLVDPPSRPVLPSGVEELPSVDPSSPGSLASSHVSPCAPVLQTFPSDSIDQSFRETSFSEDSFFSPPAEPSLPRGFFTGSTTYSALGFSPSSLSSASFSESTIGHSPINGSVGDSLNESDRIEELSCAPSNLDWTTTVTDENWNQLSPSVVKWESSSPSDAGVYNCDQQSSPESPCLDGSSHCETLIPGLPNDLAQLCLMRVPFIKYDPSYRMVCKQWRAVLSSEEFFKARKALGIQEAHISFVVHGNRVQVFSLQTYKWFCLPPLPRYDVNASPGWKVSPDGGFSDGGFSPSPELQASPEWGIDPYDWWQIDTVVVSDGTLFVIGGDREEFHSIRRPSNPTNRVHKYDFCTNRWVSVSPMQVPRSHAAAVSLGKLIYVAGGSEDTEAGASAEVYDFERNLWRVIPSMNTPMRMCVGMEHNGCFYVKGENAGPRSHVEGEIFSLLRGKWDSMTSGMRRGLERGPIASSNSYLFVADWKDSLLKVYDPEQDSWLAVTMLPARISRLVGHSNRLYGLTGKIKVDPYNHHVISDAPAEVWQLDLGRCLKNRVLGGRHLLGRDAGTTDVSRLVQRNSEQWQGLSQGGTESMAFQRGRGSILQTDLLDEFKNGVLEIPESGDCVWECLWWDPKQMVKTGGLAWVPCIAHCTLFED